MSKGASRLSLGALPRSASVKLTITVPVELKTQLEAYAEVHSRLHGPVDAVALIPHMLAAFIARDRGFKALSRSSELPRRGPRLATEDRERRSSGDSNDVRMRS